MDEHLRDADLGDEHMAANAVEGNARARAEEPIYRLFTYEQRMHYLADFVVGDGLSSELRYRAACRALALKFGVAEGTIKKDIRAVLASLTAGDDVEERRQRSIITTQRIRDAAIADGDLHAATRAQQHLDTITGVLVRQAPTVQVNLIQQNEAFRRLWDAMGKVLAEHPDVAEKVQTAFGEELERITGAKPTLQLARTIDVESE